MKANSAIQLGLYEAGQGEGPLATGAGRSGGKRLPQGAQLGGELRN